MDTSDADYFAGLTTTMTYIPSRCGLTVRPTYPTVLTLLMPELCTSHLNNLNTLSHTSAMGATATDGAAEVLSRW